MLGRAKCFTESVAMKMDVSDYIRGRYPEGYAERGQGHGCDETVDY